MIFETRARRLHRAGTALALGALMTLAACEEGAAPFDFLKPGQGAADGATDSEPARTTLVERDVEAPEVFDVTANGLWDGRPSLGGVWVAHPDVDEPERVIIRNTSNSKFVIGALFRRERDNPGPPIQVSSDAAEALGMLAGAPAMLNVTALRRETAPADDGDAPEAEETAAPADVEATALDPVADAAAAIDEAEAAGADAAGGPVDTPLAAQPTSLEKPYVQVGIFSVEQNARNTATAMRQNGMVPTVKEQTSQGKTFWRVIVGPAADHTERAVLLRKIKGVGFKDAYAVTD